MSPCEAALAEIRSTTCNNVEKRLWLEAKGTVRRLGEIPQLEMVTIIIIIIIMIQIMIIMIIMIMIAAKTLGKFWRLDQSF